LITTSSPFLLRSKVQSSVSISVFRRFASDDAQGKKVESADGEEEGSAKSAIDSVSETASSYASDAAASLTNNYEQTKESVVDGAQAAAATTGFVPRQDYERQPARQDRGSRSFGRGEDRGTYGSGGRPPVERNLVPTSSIYVGNLLFDVTANDLTREFEQYGTIKSSIIASDARGLSKG
jgi:RNA recognition motif-containing protein